MKTKRLLALIMALVMICGVFAACGKKEEAPAPSNNNQQSEQKQEEAKPVFEARDYMNSQLFTDPVTFDPQYINSSYDGGVAINIYDSLFEVTDGNYSNIQPCICKEWSSNDNCTEWIFQIRDDIKFQNGDPLTGEDVLFTLQRIQTSPVTATAAAGIESVELTEPFTIKVTCKYSLANLPAMLIGYNAGIVNKKLIEQYGDNAPETIVGTGAYKMTDWTPGAGVTLEAFNEGWRGAPAIQKVNYQVILDTNAARISFQNGEIDAYYATNASDFEVLKDGDDYAYSKYVNGTGDHLAFNTTRKWCDNVDFRKAVAYAIDRNAINDIMSGGMWTVANSQVMPGNTVYREGYEYLYDYNPDKAKEYLEKSGYDGSEVGLMYTATYPVSNAWGTTVEACLRAVGINVKMDGREYANLLECWAARDYDMILHEFAISYADPLSSFYGLYMKDGYYNVWQYGNEERDAKILACYGMDAATLAETLKEMDREAEEDLVLYVPNVQQGGLSFMPLNIYSTAKSEPMFGHVRLCYSSFLNDEQMKELYDSRIDVEGYEVWCERVAAKLGL